MRKLIANVQPRANIGRIYVYTGAVMSEFMDYVAGRNGTTKDDSVYGVVNRVNGYVDDKYVGYFDVQLNQMVVYEPFLIME